MTSQLVDTHCHLDAPQLADEPTAALLGRAAAAGVTRVVTIGTQLETSRAALALAQANHGVWATVGVDPNDIADGFGAETLAALGALAAADEVVAIGEIGLDYYWDAAPREQQARVFRDQLGLARECGLPVVIHSRDADEDTAALLLAWAEEVADDAAYASAPLGVMHCYAGNVETAERLFAAGFLISLSGIVTFHNAPVTHAVARALPLEALVLETDAPYLAPHPNRGERNEPAYVRLIAERVAELRQAPLEAVARATSANAARLFRLPADERIAAPAALEDGTP